MDTKFESLESRQMLTFTAIDPSFGVGGRAALPGTVTGPISASTLVSTKLNDGRIVVTGDDKIRFLKGDGSIDTKRVSTGFRSLAIENTRIESSTVDRKTGNVAVLRIANSFGAAAGHVEIYDAKGRKISDRALGTVLGGAITFDGNGNVLVATTTSATTNGTVQYTAHVRRFDTLGTLLNANGTTGGDSDLITTNYSSNGTDSDLTPFIRAIRTDDAGRIYLFTRAYFSSQGDMLVTEMEHLRRYSATGVYDTAYAGSSNNPVELSRVSSDDFDQNSATIGDVVVRSDGTVYAVSYYSHYNADTGSSSGGTSLRRIAPGAGTTATTVQIGTTTGLTRGYRAASIALVGDGTLLVSATDGNGAATHVLHLDATTLATVKGWSNFGDFQSTTSFFGSTTITVNDAGHYLLTSNTTNAVTEFQINGKFVPPAAGRAVLMGDGTLAVAGTSKSDAIQIRRKKGDVLVEFNGKISRFAASAVHGVLVQGNDGSDRIELVGTARSLAAAYFDGGAGNDTLVGGDQADTFVGGSGNDSLVGASGDDYLYGQDGRDTLYGNGGSDVIYGGRDNDYVASNTGGKINDNASDTLFGGAGSDTFVRETPNRYDDDADFIRDQADADRLT